MYNKIQEYKQMGYSIRKTARESDIDRKTVRKYWNMEGIALSMIEQFFNCYNPDTFGVYRIHQNTKSSLCNTLEYERSRIHMLHERMLRTHEATDAVQGRNRGIA